MSALAGVIGRRLGIRPQAKTDWTVIANLWALIIARPGVLKSPAMEASLAPLKRLGVNADKSFEAASVEHNRQVKITKLRTEAAGIAARVKLKSNAKADVSAELHIPEPEAPIRRRYIANDTTAAALGELLRQFERPACLSR
jgi:putative DNA primase/helicase